MTTQYLLLVITGKIKFFGVFITFRDFVLYHFYHYIVFDDVKNLIINISKSISPIALMFLKHYLTCF